MPKHETNSPKFIQIDYWFQLNEIPSNVWNLWLQDILNSNRISKRISALLLLCLVISTLAVDPVRDIVAQANKAAERTERFCSQIKNYADKVLECPQSSTDVKAEANKISEQAQFCLDRVAEAQQQVISGGQDLAQNQQKR